MVSLLLMWLTSFGLFIFASKASCWVGGVVLWSLARRLRSVALLRTMLTSLRAVFCPVAAFVHVYGAGGGVLVGKSVVAMRSPSAKRSCIVSACSLILFLVLILSGHVDVVIVGGVLCMSERNLSRFR